MELTQTANGGTLKLTKADWEGIGKQAGWIAKAAGPQAQQPQAQPQQVQQPKQMQIFNQQYQNLMRTLSSGLRPDIQNQASAAFSNAFNSLRTVLADPNSWVQ
jgi:hypothetical protein